MPKINGGIIGKSNRPNLSSAGGVWSLTDIENSLRLGAWPLGRSTSAMLLANSISPFIHAYQWYPSSVGGVSAGFGTKYSNPSTAAAGSNTNGGDVKFNGDGSVIAITSVATPYIEAYRWSSSGFGTKYSNPSTGLSAGTSQGVTFDEVSDYIFIVNNATPFIHAYQWTNSSGFGTKYSNPASLPPSLGTSIDYVGAASPALVVGCITSPYHIAYPWSSSGFGTKYTNFSPTTSNDLNSTKFHPAGSAVFFAGILTPFIHAWPWSSTTGFGTKYGNPSSLLPSVARFLSITSSGSDVAVTGGNSGQGLHAYPWNTSSGWGTKYGNPSTPPGGTSYGVSFDPTDLNVAVGMSLSPYVNAYPWSGSGFGTKYSNPATLLTNEGVSIAFATVQS